MAPINLPSSLHSDTILVVDDEPEHIEWLIDYIEARGLKTIVVNNVSQAIAAASSSQFRGYIVDLNIPMGDWVPTFAIPNDTYEKYRGLLVIKYVRTQGNKGRNVIAYSAHINDLINAEIKVLYSEYIAKGRAKEFKIGVEEMLTKSLGAKSALKSTKKN